MVLLRYNYLYCATEILSECCSLGSDVRVCKYLRTSETIGQEVCLCVRAWVCARATLT